MNTETPFRFRRRILAASLLTLGAAATAQASFVRSDIDYQYFRDFAENKGQFTPGARNIEIFNKNGQSVGVMLRDAPMPDFSMVSTSGVATLIAPQYLASVQHNTGYGSVRFGQAGSNPDAHHFDYRLVDRNNYPRANPNVSVPTQEDYHVPRLHKLVTEAAPAAMTSAGTAKGVYGNRDRFPTFVRLGSGRQSVRDPQGNDTQVGGAYQYLTGGNPLKVLDTSAGIIQGSTPNRTVALYIDTYGPMPTLTDGGDSGSPLFAYDKQENRWVTVGVLRGGNKANYNVFLIQKRDFAEERMREDFGAQIDNPTDRAVFEWTAAGNSSTLSNASASWHIDLVDTSLSARDKNTERPSLNHGKSLVFSGRRGVLRLNGDINQGAGALKFDTDFNVTGAAANTTWLGAGVDIAAGKTVNWQVHNPAGDRLSKIGAGTLVVNGAGRNLGSISVGDGTVVLSQRSDNHSAKQAFSEVGIVSGRPTVVLGSADQVNPDNIYFGFRGGRLDVNGNHLTFSRIQNADSGARIANNNANRSATIVLNRRPQLMTTEEVPLVQRRDTARNNTTVVFEYINQHRGNRTDYFMFKKGGQFVSYYPTDGTSNDNWEFLSSNRDEAFRIYTERENARRIAEYANDAYLGYLGEQPGSDKHNGRLDVVYRPSYGGDLLMLSGGTNLNGTLAVENGTLLLSGSPVLHARDMQKKEDVVRENEWIDRDYNATTFAVSHYGKLQTGRNVRTLRGHLNLSGNAQAAIGYIQGQTPVCVRSDYDGKTTCAAGNISEPVLSNLTATRLEGDTVLRDFSTLTLGGRVVYDRSITADRSTTLNLAGAHWKMPDNASIGSLNGSNGGEITLNPVVSGSPQNYRTLTINGDLSGEMRFNYLTDIAGKRGDRVVVNGLASGNHTLAVGNTAQEPNHTDRLTLLELNHGAQGQSHVNITLSNNNGQNHVDAGTLRYTLIADENHHYRLYNPEKEREQAQAKAAAEAAKQQEASRRLAEAETARQNAERLAAQAEAARAEAARALSESEAAKARLEAAGRDHAAALQAARDEAQAAAVRAQNSEQTAREAQRLADEAQAQRQAAEAAKQTAEQQLNEARAQTAQAQTAKQTAEQQLAAARTQTQAAEAAKQAAEQQTAQAEAGLRQALADKDAAEAARREAEARLQNQQGSSSQALAEAQRQAQAAQQRADEAAARAQAAETEKNRLQTVLDETQNQAETARRAEQQALELVRQARTEQAAADAARQTAETARAEAERRHQDAQAALSRAEAEKQQLQQNQNADAAALQAARNEAEAARRAAQQSEQAKAEAERLAAEAQSRSQAAQAAQTQAQQAAEQAARRAEAAEESRAQAQAAQQQAEQSLTAAQAALNQAQAARSEAEANARRAEAARRLAEQNQTAGAAALQAARNDLQAAQTRAEEAQNRARAAEAEKARAQTALAEAQAQAQAARLAESEAQARAQAQAQQLQAAQAQAQAAETAKNEAEIRLAAAQTAREKAETARAQAEAARQGSEDQRRAAEEKARLAEANAAAAAEAAKQAAARADAAEAERGKAVSDANKAQAGLQAAANDHEAAARARAEAERKLAEETAKRRAAEAALREPQAVYLSRYANAAVSELSAQAHGAMETGRMVEDKVRGGQKGVWVETDSVKNRIGNDSHRPYVRERHSIRAGAAGTVETGIGDLTVGTLFGHSRDRQTYDGGSRAAGQTNLWGVYGKLALENGLYVSSDAAYGRARNKADDGSRHERGLAHWGAGVGGSWTPGGLTVSPQLNVRRYRLGGSSYRLYEPADGSSMEVKQKTAAWNVYSAAVDVRKAFELSGGVKIEPSAAVSYRSGGELRGLAANGRDLAVRVDGQWTYEAGLGVSAGHWEARLRGGYGHGRGIGGRGSVGLGLRYWW